MRIGLLVLAIVSSLLVACTSAGGGASSSLQIPSGLIGQVFLPTSGGAFEPGYDLEGVQFFTSKMDIVLIHAGLTDTWTISDDFKDDSVVDDFEDAGFVQRYIIRINGSEKRFEFETGTNWSDVTFTYLENGNLKITTSLIRN